MNIHTPIIRDWTEAEVETLLNMRARGYSASQIGAAIGKTRCAVLGKAKRLKLERLTTSPGRRGSGAPKPPKPPKAKLKKAGGWLSNRELLQVSRVFRPDQEATNAHVKKLQTITEIVPVEAIPSRNIPITELNAYHCRYITAGEGADARFCGCVTKPGKSWCAGHYSRVFRKADARELA